MVLDLAKVQMFVCMSKAVCLHPCLHEEQSASLLRLACLYQAGQHGLTEISHSIDAAYDEMQLGLMHIAHIYGHQKNKVGIMLSSHWRPASMPQCNLRRQCTFAKRLHETASFFTSSIVGSRCFLYLALGCHRSYCACNALPDSTASDQPYLPVYTPIHAAAWRHIRN